MITALCKYKGGPCASSNQQVENESTPNVHTRTIQDDCSAANVTNVFHISTNAVDQQRLPSARNVHSTAQPSVPAPPYESISEDLPPSYEESVRYMK